MSKRMMMPMTKKEDLIFTILCVLFMCMGMLIYNMFLVMGVNWEAIQAAWALVPLTFAVCFCVDHFIACPISTLIMKHVARPWMKPWLQIALFQFFTVCQIAVLESMYGALVQVGFTSEVWMCWLHHIPLNFIVALPLMVLVCSPLMRLLFRFLVPVPADAMAQMETQPDTAAKLTGEQEV